MYPLDPLPQYLHSWLALDLISSVPIKVLRVLILYNLIGAYQGTACTAVLRVLHCVYSVLCTLYSVLCTLYSVRCTHTLFSVLILCTLYKTVTLLVPAVSRLSYLIHSPHTHPICQPIDGHLAGAGSEQAILPHTLPIHTPYRRSPC
jgi:hypothetical protein